MDLDLLIATTTILFFIGLLIISGYLSYRQDVEYDKLAKKQKEYFMKTITTKARIGFKLNNGTIKFTDSYEGYVYDANRLSHKLDIKVVTAYEVAKTRMRDLNNQTLIFDKDGVGYPLCNIVELWVVEEKK